MPKMKIAIVLKPGADFELQERDIPQPPGGTCRKPAAFASVTISSKDGLWPGVNYPRSPGHEVAGIIDEVGPGVTIWKKGQRVGAGNDPLQAPPILMIGGSNHSRASPPTPKTLCALPNSPGVRPMIERFPLTKVNEAYARMTNGKAPFRVVLTM